MKRLGGWWRLWIFLSVLWGVAVVTVVIADWPGNAAKRVLSEEDMKLLSPQTQKMLADAKTKEVLDLLDKDPLAGLRSDNYIPAPDEPLLIPYVMRSGQELRLLCGTESLDAVKQDYERVQNLTLSNARFKMVGFAFLFWLVPGLSVLAFGLGFRWVVRGFKKELG